jgi:hypothetical protein
LVVVGQLLTLSDILLRKDQDVALAVDDWGLCVTISIAGVIQISCFAAKEGSVNDVLVVDLEHVAIADSLFFVSLLPHVSHFVSDDFSDVLDQNVSFFQSLLGEQSYSVDLALSDLEFLGGCQGLSVLSGERQSRVGGLLGVTCHVCGQLLLDLGFPILLGLDQLTSDGGEVALSLWLIFFLARLEVLQELSRVDPGSLTLSNDLILVGHVPRTQVVDRKLVHLIVPLV